MAAKRAKRNASTKASATPKTPKQEVSFQRTPPDQEWITAELAKHGFEVGDEIKVDGEGNRIYKICGAWWDGSIACSAGEGIRSFMPDWCYKAWTVNSRGTRVEAKRPKEIAGKRAAWLAERGQTARLIAEAKASDEED